MAEAEGSSGATEKGTSAIANHYQATTVKT
jgi:hypothetical protein